MPSASSNSEKDFEDLNIPQDAKEGRRKFLSVMQSGMTKIEFLKTRLEMISQVIGEEDMAQLAARGKLESVISKFREVTVNVGDFRAEFMTSITQLKDMAVTAIDKITRDMSGTCGLPPAVYSSFLLVASRHLEKQSKNTDLKAFQKDTLTNKATEWNFNSVLGLYRQAVKSQKPLIHHALMSVTEGQDDDVRNKLLKELINSLDQLCIRGNNHIIMYYTVS